MKDVKSKPAAPVTPAAATETPKPDTAVKAVAAAAAKVAKAVAPKAGPKAAEQDIFETVAPAEPAETVEAAPETLPASEAVAPANAGASVVDAIVEPVTEAAKTMQAAVEQAPAEARKTVEALAEGSKQAVTFGAEQARQAFDTARERSETLTQALDAAYASAMKGFGEINARLLDNMRANSDATMEFVRAAMQTKSVSELVALQTQHLRSHYEMMSTQARELAALAAKVAEEAAAPARSAVSKVTGRNG